jgi:beta-glucosidase-like glycosyl hydrolase/CubicO group peptidase (beta-lactamase class C family)
MTLEEKAGQLILVRAAGLPVHEDSATARHLLAEIRELHLGGIVLFESEAGSIAPLLNRLQQASRLPLLVAADLERGLAFRVRRGAVPLPYAMAFGAGRAAEAARFAGQVTAREARALGLHWALAPVVDVNNDPANPVINLRSFGEDPELVGSLGRAFVEGAQAGGLLAAAKHFPGHGDTNVDSHTGLPVLALDRPRLEAMEWPPFRQAIEAGVASIMTGHIAIPALDPSGQPATLSPILTEQLLRQELGFDGLIVTDSMGMAGVGGVWSGGAAVRAVEAGADVVLLPPDPRVAFQALVRAVHEGQLTEARLDASVLRILGAKARLGLHRDRLVDEGAPARDLGRPDDLEKAQEIAERSMTLLRNDSGLLPLRAETPLSILHVSLSNERQNPFVQGIPRRELAARRIPVEELELWGDSSEAEVEEVLAAVAKHTHVIASVFARGTSTEVPASHRRLLAALAEGPTPTVTLLFGSPYLALDLPRTPGLLAAYGAVPSSQRAAVRALLGEISITGKLPVTLPNLFPFGHGIDLERHPMTLLPADPETSGFRPGAMAEVDRVLEDFLAQGAFPGAVLAVGYRGKLVHLRPFGKLSYAEGASPVAADTLYDLASLTKVIATTTMAMILVDEKRLNLDAPVQDFLPLFLGPGKEKVTVRHLLTHSSGVDWWAPLYETLQGKEAYLERIQAMDLVYEPGTKTLYSDLGLILLGEILERVSGTTLDDFARGRIFEPLGMKDTLYRPGPELLPRIAPTEQDGWRGRMVHGEVHDENAFALSGVAPHAGLFGTAPDLARFAQMLLNGGVLEHKRIVARQTLEAFTRRADIPDSTRALGWDTKSEEGSSAGSLFSPSSYGHTGFTGTSLWIDPERELFVILLTNRVHPTRENILIRQVRPAVADAVVRGLAAL